jgi:hypothetical protein
MTVQTKYKVHLRNPHPKQEEFLRSPKKRKIIRAGRRGGKTVGIGIITVEKFLDGRRVLYTAPTSEQTDAFWYEITTALAEPIEAGVYKKNEAERYIERVGTQNRIKAKTAWNANTLRGDYADLLIFDEYQLTAEDAWEVVGQPMLMDNDGDAVFIYTPPSLSSTGISKARDPRHAAKMFKEKQSDPEWGCFHFTSFDNPYLSQEGLKRATVGMTMDAYRKEILAEDDEIQDSWLVYPFNDRVCKIPRFPIPKNWLIYSGHDFGSANPAALFVAQDPGTAFFYAFREYLPGARATDKQVEDWKLLTEGYNVIRRVGGNHQEQDSRQNYTAHGWPITEPKISGAGAVKVQVDRVRDIMALNKLYVFDDLIYYLTELANCLWKLDESGKPTNEIDNEKIYHLSACARYLLSEFTPETVMSGKRAVPRENY